MRKKTDNLEILTLEDKDKSKRKLKINFKFNKLLLIIPLILLSLLIVSSFKTNLFKGGVNRLFAFTGVYTEEIK